jgi:hypothetical protein
VSVVGRRIFGVAALATLAVVAAAVVVDDRHDYVHSVDFFPAAVNGLALVVIVVVWFGATAIWAWGQMKGAPSNRV